MLFLSFVTELRHRTIFRNESLKTILKIIDEIVMKDIFFHSDLLLFLNILTFLVTSTSKSVYFHCII